MVRGRRWAATGASGLGAVLVLLGTTALAPAAGARSLPEAGAARTCPRTLAPAVAADPHPHALRVFAIQFLQRPLDLVDAASYADAIDCVMRTAVAPYLARGRPNLVVFDEDIGLETIAVGPRGAAAREMLRTGVQSCRGQASPCATIATLQALNGAYARALNYLGPRFAGLQGNALGKSFIAATDDFVRVFMTTMATEARRYGVYVIASNTQAPFRLTRERTAVAALRDPAAPNVKAVYAPTEARAYDQTFVWGPHVSSPNAPAPLANLLAVNRKVPLTSFEQALQFASGPTSGAAAIANLRPVSIPGTAARLGLATSLPAFTYGNPAPAGADACKDVAITYMNCLDHLGANILIQADANDGAWTGGDGNDTLEHWQPLSWMGSAWRAVTDPAVHFRYAVNPFMVGNLADTPFDGQSAILQRGRTGAACNYVGNRSFVAGDDDPALRGYAGPKPEFLALAPWATADGPRADLRPIGAALAAGTGRAHYVQTAVIADLPFPADRGRRGCVIAGHH